MFLVSNRGAAQSVSRPRPRTRTAELGWTPRPPSPGGGHSLVAAEWNLLDNPHDSSHEVEECPLRVLIRLQDRRRGGPVSTPRASAGGDPRSSGHCLLQHPALFAVRRRTGWKSGQMLKFTHVSPAALFLAGLAQGWGEESQPPEMPGLNPWDL